uniref:Uncharacterized protein n=1 Tax=Octopus bimaculoides TaxID=37653 RepID=A0A0L8GWM3_OCTBM
MITTTATILTILTIAITRGRDETSKRLFPPHLYILFLFYFIFPRGYHCSAMD